MSTIEATVEAGQSYTADAGLAGTPAALSESVPFQNAHAEIGDMTAAQAIKICPFLGGVAARNPELALRQATAYIDDVNKLTAVATENPDPDVSTPAKDSFWSSLQQEFSEIPVKRTDSALVKEIVDPKTEKHLIADQAAAAKILADTAAAGDEKDAAPTIEHLTSYKETEPAQPKPADRTIHLPTRKTQPEPSKPAMPILPTSLIPSTAKEPRVHKNVIIAKADTVPAGILTDMSLSTLVEGSSDAVAEFVAELPVSVEVTPSNAIPTVAPEAAVELTNIEPLTMEIFEQIMQVNADRTILHEQTDSSEMISVDDSQPPADLESIRSHADDQPLEIILAQLISYGDGTVNKEQDTGLIVAIEELNTTLQIIFETAEDTDCPPEITVQLVTHITRVLEQSGYNQPKEALLRFVSTYGTVCLLDTLMTVCHAVLSKDSQEYLRRVGGRHSSASASDDLGRLGLMKALFALVMGNTLVLLPTRR